MKSISPLDAIHSFAASAPQRPARTSFDPIDAEFMARMANVCGNYIARIQSVRPGHGGVVLAPVPMLAQRKFRIYLIYLRASAVIVMMRNNVAFFPSGCERKWLRWPANEWDARQPAVKSICKLAFSPAEREKAQSLFSGQMGNEFVRKQIRKI